MCELYYNKIAVSVALETRNTVGDVH
jgi:hypothetical protein